MCFRLFPGWDWRQNSSIHPKIGANVGGDGREACCSLCCTSSPACSLAWSLLAKTKRGSPVQNQAISMGRRLLTYSVPCLSTVINSNAWNKLGKKLAAVCRLQKSVQINKHCRVPLGSYWPVWGSHSILEICFSSPYQVQILLCWVRPMVHLRFMLD